MEKYKPSATPQDVPPDTRRFLNAELRRLSNMLANLDEVQLAVLGTEPASPRNGMMVYADGTSWDPSEAGLGPGFYVYQSNAWWRVVLSGPYPIP